MTHAVRKEFMEEAVRLSVEGMRKNHGGPFGCVVVRDGAVIGRGFNRVLSDNDPTAHAEIVAIREACRALNSYQLDGCEIYSSCEPCPMCLAAIYWARPARVFFSNSHLDAARIGFDDAFIYGELRLAAPQRKVPVLHLPVPEAESAFREWEAKEDKVRY